MSRATTKASIPLPLLDRLIDEPLPQDHEARSTPSDQPHNGRSFAGVRAELVRRDLVRLRLDAILRDLEVLLNTRRSVVSLPETPGELNRSVLDFGLAALHRAGTMSAGRRDSLRMDVESTIQRFEPRLADVHVFLEAGPRPPEHVGLRIEASLAGSGPVSLHASLDSTTGRLGIREDLP